MKILEMLSEQERTQLLDGTTVGFFENLLVPTDSFYDSLYDICLGYFISHSGCKTVSPTVEKLMYLTNSEVITPTINATLSTIIRNKFIDKWERIYNALIVEQYNVLDNKTYTETKTGDNTDTINYNSTVEDDGNTGTNVTTSTTNENNSDVFGFNSSTAVGSDVDSGTNTETVIGDKESNTSHNIRTKGGNDSKTLTINETHNTSGRDVSAPELIKKELNFRNSTTFFDIVYNDIDSITALQIYI